MQRALRNVKSSLNDGEYRKLYPQGSKPAKFYGTAKLHKIPRNSTNDHDLPLRPIVSNIGSATYETSKYLANLLSPLSKSIYTIESTKQFISQVKDIVIPNGYSLVSFDVQSLFTNVPLDYTINIILERVYVDRDLQINIDQKDLKKLLTLCTKNVHFSFNNDIYIQSDGVAMGSPLGPVLANIFMVKLENDVIPTLSNLTLWKRYVDDTIAVIKNGEMNNILQKLNSFHPFIKFTCEVETDNCIAFLDVNIERQADNSIETSVYRKSTNSNLYMHWDSYAPKHWKIGTLRSLIQRAHIVCSTEVKYQDELKHITSVFTKINGYPYSVVQQIRNKFKFNEVVNTEREIENNVDQNIKTPLLKLPYKGNMGMNIINKYKKILKNHLPSNVQPRVVFNSKKLSSNFNIKDQVKFTHNYDLVYKYECKEINCNARYIGETSRRISERIKDHCFRDKRSHIYQHHQEHGHGEPEEKDFEILETGFKNYKKRKLAEAIYIRNQKPNLNIQEQSYPLKLFA